MERTKEITVTVLNQTIKALEEYEKVLELSKGEIIDRLALNCQIDDPTYAAATILDYIFMVVYSQHKKQFKTTAYTIMTYLCDMLIKLKEADLDTVIKNLKNEYKEYSKRIAVMEKENTAKCETE